MGGAIIRPLPGASHGGLPVKGVPAWRGVPSAEVRGFAMATEADALTGRSLALRPLEVDDFDEWTALRKRNRGPLASIEADWPDEFVDPADSQETFAAFVEFADAERGADREYGVGIWHEGELIGEAGLYGIVRASLQSTQLRMWIDADHVGHGHAGEAFFLLCRLAFRNLGLHRVEAAVLPENEAVKRALEKFGVRSEGLASGYLRVAGEWRDHERYGITAEEFDQREDELTRQHALG